MSKGKITGAGFAWFAVFVIALIPISTIVSGWALSLLWAWFIVPVFGLPVLSIAQAIGIALIPSYFLANVARTDEDKDKDKSNLAALVVQVYGKVLSRPLSAVAIGWIVKQFV